MPEALASAEESSAAAEEVSASTEELTAQAEELVASAATLAEMARALEDLVGRFKLEDGLVIPLPQRPTESGKRPIRLGELRSRIA